MPAESSVQRPRLIDITAALIIAGYGVLLLITALTLPLRLDEILQMLAFAPHFSFQRMVGWIAQTPGAVPLSYFAQLPLLAIRPDSRLLARLPSVIFAVLSCFAFFRLVVKTPLKRPRLALLVFMFLPLHYAVSVQGRSYELALFLSLTSLLTFRELIKGPTIQKAITYGVLLVLCLFANPASYLPAIGYLLFLFRFAGNAGSRRVIWYALPATGFPPLLFLAYYAWAHPQVSSKWLTSPGTSMYNEPLYLLLGEAPGSASWVDFVPAVVAALLLVGILLALWSTFRPQLRQAPNRILLFCLFGGILSALGIEELISRSSNRAFDLGDAVFAVPAAVVLFIAGFEWLLRRSFVSSVPKFLPAVIPLIACIPADVALYSGDSRDVSAEAAAIVPELTGDSCVVFVSEGYSRALFSLFQPSLAKHECWNFFHSRIVLAEHPYVRPDQSADAESFFRGLNFVEKERKSVGGGQILILQQQK